jgi:hypothetical protein
MTHIAILPTCRVNYLLHQTRSPISLLLASLLIQFLSILKGDLLGDQRMRSPLWVISEFSPCLRRSRRVYHWFSLIAPSCPRWPAFSDYKTKSLPASSPALFYGPILSFPLSWDRGHFETVVAAEPIASGLSNDTRTVFFFGRAIH